MLDIFVCGKLFFIIFGFVFCCFGFVGVLFGFFSFKELHWTKLLN